MVPIASEIKPTKTAKKKKFPDLRKMIKRKRNDEHRKIMRELKKLKFSLPVRKIKLENSTAPFIEKIQLQERKRN